MTIGGNSVKLVVLVLEDDKSFTFEDQTTFNLQAGSRPSAYCYIRDQINEYLRHRHVSCVGVKESALSRSGMRMSHLYSAELRGVALAAAAAACENVKLTNKSQVSKNFGERKVDEYLGDDKWWQERSLDSIQKGMREAAFAVINHFA